MKKPAAKSYALRIDAQLVKPLQELKKQNRRSLNAEINAALETWIVSSHAAGTAHEDAPPIPATSGAVNSSKAKRKPAKKQPELSAATAAATPGDP
jgi:hypothetical protein